MALIEAELNNIKNEVVKMFVLVQTQIDNSRISIETGDKEVAKNVKSNEEFVNELEVKIDSLCENMLARFTPVAADLRFTLSIIKINSYLERIGDAAKGIANYVLKNDFNDYEKYIQISRCHEIFEYATKILTLTLQAFENEDTSTAKTVFKLNETLDELCTQARIVVSGHIAHNPTDAQSAINFLSALRKLSRVGDQATNICEEVVFYLEARNIKHIRQY